MKLIMEINKLVKIIVVKENETIIKYIFIC